MVGALAAPAHAAAVSTVVDGVTYTADDANVAAGATATAYDTAFGTVVTIPATVVIGGTTYSVTTIGDNAFFDNALTWLTLPDSVTTIGEIAFFANALTSVRFLGAVPETFGGNVFSNDPLVSYYWSYGAPQTVGGFTSPKWNGYRTQALPDPVDSLLAATGVASPALPAGIGSLVLLAGVELILARRRTTYVVHRASAFAVPPGPPPSAPQWPGSPIPRRTPTSGPAPPPRNSVDLPT